MEKRLQKSIYTVLFLIAFIGNNTFAGNPITISKDFTMFTSGNLQGYMQPLFTSVEQSMNSNLYTNASYVEKFTISLDLSALGMFIPNSQKTFNAERPDLYGNTVYTQTAEIRNGQILKNYTKDNMQPTIYGGTSTAIFAVPQNDMSPAINYKTVAYAEGNNIDFMSGLPILQLIAGFPTRSELRLRLWEIPIQNTSLWYYGIIANQQFDHFLNLFPQKYQMALAANLAYNHISRNPGLTLNSWSAGVHYSKLWDFQGSGQMTGYLGLQYEDMTGSFEAIKDTAGMSGYLVDSPYLEIRDPIAYAKQQGWFDAKGNPQPRLTFDIHSQTHFRAMLGLSYRYSFLEIHGDAAYASQPILTAGLTFWIASFGGHEEKVRLEKIEKLENN